MPKHFLNHCWLDVSHNLINIQPYVSEIQRKTLPFKKIYWKCKLFPSRKYIENMSAVSSHLNSGFNVLMQSCTFIEGNFVISIPADAQPPIRYQTSSRCWGGDQDKSFFFFQSSNSFFSSENQVTLLKKGPFFKYHSTWRVNNAHYWITIILIKAHWGLTNLNEPGF